MHILLLRSEEQAAERSLVFGNVSFATVPRRGAMETASGFRVSSSPYIAGGHTVTEQALARQPSIFRDPNAKGKARVILPKEAPRYPESRHTLPKKHHNINHIPITDRPGKAHYDPVLLGGKSVIDHYPYAAAAEKECMSDPLGELAAMRAGH